MENPVRRQFQLAEFAVNTGEYVERGYPKRNHAIIGCGKRVISVLC